MLLITEKTISEILEITIKKSNYVDFDETL